MNFLLFSLLVLSFISTSSGNTAPSNRGLQASFLSRAIDRWGPYNKLLLDPPDARVNDEWYMHVRSYTNFVPVIESDLRWNWWSAIQQSKVSFSSFFRWLPSLTRWLYSTNLKGAYMLYFSERNDREKNSYSRTIIKFHGRDQDLALECDNDQQLANELNARVISLEFSGFGVLHETKATQLYGLASCRAAIRHMIQYRGLIFDKSTFFYGESIGAAFATDIVHGLHRTGHINPDKFGGLILLTPFPSLGQLARRDLPAILAKPWVRDIVRMEKKLQQIPAKVYILATNTKLEDKAHMQCFSAEPAYDRSKIPYEFAVDLVKARKKQGHPVIFRSMETSDSLETYLFGLRMLQQIVLGKVLLSDPFFENPNTLYQFRRESLFYFIRPRSIEDCLGPFDRDFRPRTFTPGPLYNPREFYIGTGLSRFARFFAVDQVLAVFGFVVGETGRLEASKWLRSYLTFLWYVVVYDKMTDVKELLQKKKLDVAAVRSWYTNGQTPPNAKFKKVFDQVDKIVKAGLEDFVNVTRNPNRIEVRYEEGAFQELRRLVIGNALDIETNCREPELMKEAFAWMKGWKREDQTKEKAKEKTDSAVEKPVE